MAAGTKTVDNDGVDAGKYKFLSANFFRGSVKGQINSVYKSLNINPEKLAEYKQALENGDASLGLHLTKQQAKKLMEMGISIPDGVTIVSPRRATSEDNE